MTCPRCGAERGNDGVCPNCDVPNPPQAVEPRAVRAAGALAGGVLLGVAGTVAMYVIGFFFFNVGPRSTMDYGFSKVAAAVWLLETAGVVAGLAYLFRIKPRAGQMRAFKPMLLVAGFVMLGGISICALWSGQDLLAK